jgi:NADH-quinone oxidoreductase subunit J
MIEFWILAVIMIASAIWCITATKPVYSVVALLLHFAALAATYLTLNAEFLAVIQLIVYSGAILMLFLFVIALLSSGVAPFSQGPDRLPRIGYPGIALVVIALGALVFVLAHVSVSTPAAPAGAALGPAGTANVFGSVGDFGTALFTTYLLPFEITALILMVAVIGVILLAGDAAPYRSPSKKHAAEVRREMREAILRSGEQ